MWIETIEGPCISKPNNMVFDRFICGINATNHVMEWRSHKLICFFDSAVVTPNLTTWQRTFFSAICKAYALSLYFNERFVTKENFQPIIICVIVWVRRSESCNGTNWKKRAKGERHRPMWQILHIRLYIKNSTLPTFAYAVSTTVSCAVRVKRRYGLDCWQSDWRSKSLSMRKFATAAQGFLLDLVW